MNTASPANHANYAPQALANQATAAGLIGLTGLVAGWILGCAAVLWYARLDVGMHAPLLHTAWVWAWEMLRGGHLILATTPAWLGFVPTTCALLCATVGGVLGWALEHRPDEHHRRGYRVADEDPSGVAEALRGVGEDADGILLHPEARMSMAQECRHVMITGGAGSGKTTILTPVIQQVIERGDHLLVFDLKGDFASTIPNASLLAPWDARSIAWRVGADVRTRLDATALAETLIPASEREGDQIWSNGARALLTALVAQLQRTRKTAWGLNHLAQITARALADYDTLLRIVEKEHPPAKAFLKGEDSRLTASFLAELASHLTGVIDLGVGQDAIPDTGESWSVDAWLSGRAPRTAILGYLPSAPGLSRAWVSSILEQTVRRLSVLPDCRPEERRVWIIVDEAPQAGRVPSLAQAIVTGRSKGLRVIVGAQSIAQIRQIYGREQATEWESSTATKIVCQTTSVEDQKWASDLLGECEVERYQRQNSPGAAGRGESQVIESWVLVRERVMLPTDFARLLGVTPQGPRALLLSGGAAAILKWGWPQVDTVREPRIEADWVQPGYQRPAWGGVPPKVGAPEEQEARQRPAVQFRRANEPTSPPPRTAGGVIHAQQAQLAGQPEQGNPIQDAIVDRLTSVALDHVVPGLGTALDLTQTIADTAAPRRAAGSNFPGRPIDERHAPGSKADEPRAAEDDNQQENER